MVKVEIVENPQPAPATVGGDRRANTDTRVPILSPGCENTNGRISVWIALHFLEILLALTERRGRNHMQRIEIARYRPG